MRLAPRGVALLLVAAAAALTASLDPEELFEQTRVKVLNSAKRLPRYTCVETVSRAQYAPPRQSPGTCGELIARRQVSDVQGDLVMHDRLRLDVAVINGEEMFSWAGGNNFETHDVNRLVGGGASGSGDFGSFLESVFGSAPDSIRYDGLRNNLALFEYVVPLARSNYRYRSDLFGAARKTGYRGTFSVDPSGNDVKQLVVETDEFEPGDRACNVRHVMDYQRVHLGDGDFLLPEVSTMRALYRDGGESVNETHYSTCREYVGQSSIRFDDSAPSAPLPPAPAKTGPPALPPGTSLQIALTEPIDSQTSAAGDEVKALAKFGNETDRVHGRIIRLGQFMTPYPRWILALRFDSIERGGVQQPLSLTPVDSVTNSPFAGLPADAGVFVFYGRGDLLLDQTFRSAWETR